MNGTNPAVSIQIIWAAMAASPIIMAALGFAFAATLPADPHEAPMIDPAFRTTLFVALGSAGVVAAFGSLLVRRLLTARLPERGAGQQALLVTVIIPMALAEAPAIFGFVIALLTRDLVFPGFLWGISLAAAFLHYPRREWIEAQLHD